MELLRTDTLEEAREKLEAQTKDFALRTSRVEIEKALGRICAADVRSKENVPAFRRSTVDGYAVAASDTYGAGEAGPVFFKVRGHVRIEEQAEMCLGAQDAAQGGSQRGAVSALGRLNGALAVGAALRRRSTPLRHRIL